MFYCIFTHWKMVSFAGDINTKWTMFLRWKILCVCVCSFFMKLIKKLRWQLLNYIFCYIFMHWTMVSFADNTKWTMFSRWKYHFYYFYLFLFYQISQKTLMWYFIIYFVTHSHIERWSDLQIVQNEQYFCVENNIYICWVSSFSYINGHWLVLLLWKSFTQLLFLTLLISYNDMFYVFMNHLGLVGMVAIKM